MFDNGCYYCRRYDVVVVILSWKMRVFESECVYECACARVFFFFFVLNDGVI